MSENFVDLGSVTVPSGVLVLGMGGWIDEWPALGRPLSERAIEAAASGGGHLQDGLCEAVAVPAAKDRPLTVRASTAPSPFDDEPAIATLEIDLGLPWPRDRAAPIELGDLPVDPCGTVVGDAVVLDSWTGLTGEPADGLADVTYWGRYEDDAHALFGGARIAQYGVDGPYGWLDLPLAAATAREAELRAWRDRHHGNGLMVSVEEHTDFNRFHRAGWHHPLRAGTIEVGGSPVLGIAWDPGDHSMRHNGERAFGHVYPVTLDVGETGAMLLRWTITRRDNAGVLPRQGDDGLPARSS